MTDTVAILTSETSAELIEKGYSGDWSFNRPRAEAREYIVCVRRRAKGDSDLQKKVFLIAKLKFVTDAPKPFRYRLHFDEYAELDDVTIERPWRNPVSYTSLEDLGIDPSELEFKRRRVRLSSAVGQQLEKTPEQPRRKPKGLDIAGAKKALAEHYDVSVDSIEIVIRG